MQNDRPVRFDRLLREFPTEDYASVLAALETLSRARVAFRVEEGWILQPPPVASRASSAYATLSRIHR